MIVCQCTQRLDEKIQQMVQIANRIIKQDFLVRESSLHPKTHVKEQW
jgi:hypothetical protein